MAVSLEVLRCQAVGRCTAERMYCPAYYVLDISRAVFCGRFRQIPAGVGRLCSCCQYFGYIQKFKKKGQK